MTSARKIAAIVACALMLGGTLVVLPGPTNVFRVSAQEPVILTIGYAQSPDNLNPFAGYLSISYQIYMLMYDMLVGVDKDLNPCPQLAASWEHTPDGMTWNYSLVRNAKWHDGVNITAHDVAFTYNLILDNPGPCALYIDYLRNFTSVTALDDYTVQITTDTPKATMLSIIAPILPEHLWGAVPAGQLDKVNPFSTLYFPNGPVGSGPFVLYAYAVDDITKFRKFADYYGGIVHFDELWLKIFLDTEAMLNALYAGDIDIASQVPPNVWTTVLGHDNIDGQAVREISMTELGLNVCPVDMRYAGASTNYELLNTSVRKAIAMAINKTDLLQNVYYGLGDMGGSHIAPASAFWHYNITPAEEYKFNLAQANALLDASGYIDTDSDGIRENGTSGAELSFLFNVIIDNSEDVQAGTRIANWLDQIGIYAPPQAVSEDSIITQWIGMKYDMYIWGWGGDADPSFMLSVMTTDQVPDSKNDWSAWSDCFYANSYYDQLFQQQQNEVDPNARQEIVHEMQQILYRDSPYVVLVNPFGLYAYRTDRFTNWPDMVSHPGMTTMSGWTGGAWLFYEILPYTWTGPTNVVAGEDGEAAVNETISFTGSASDPDDPIASLTWTWEFLEPIGTTIVKTGQTVTYKFVNLGTVTIKLTVTDPDDQSMSDTIIFVVKEYENAGWLEGYVKDSSGDPIEAAIVTVVENTRTTDATGHYNFTLVAGTYNVTADAVGFAASGEQMVVITKDSLTWQNFTLVSNAGTLAGQVTDEKTGEPLEGALLVVKLGDVNRQDMTDANGNYSIDLLEAGRYNVNASVSGYETFMTSVTITAGQTTTLDISLQEGGKGGELSTAILAAIIGIIVLVIAAAVVLMLMKRRKAEEPPAAPPPSPPKT